MADVIFITHFVLLLTFKLCPGEKQSIGLREVDVSMDNEEPPDPLEHRQITGGISTQKRYKCLSCDPPDCSSEETCNDAITCWKSKVQEADGTQQLSRGCTIKPEQMPLICSKQQPVGNGSGKKRQASSSTRGGQFSVVCCQGDLCNNGPFPDLPSQYSPEQSNGVEDYAVKLTLAILGPMVGLGVVGSGILACILIRRTRRKRPLVPRRNKLLVDSELEPSSLHFSSSPSTTSTYHTHELRATAAGDSTLKEYLDGRSLTSGSGSGLPLLVQRTLAKQVALVECLGSGSGGGGGFGGEVWRGVWHGECVAVKIYFSRDEAAWTRETEVYSRLLPSRHDNILGYVGTDMTSRGSCTQLWLVTHYHPLGSLYNHLNRSPHPLTHHQTLNICLSVANGLLYLHTEINGTRGKPAMSHRDLKTKNILVKANGACAISDFALAVTQERLTMDRVDLRQGTKRYMSPEVLDQTINIECLESFRRADIYSLALVMWEVSRRCVSSGVALDYAAPYSEWLSGSNQEPSFEEMRKLVSLNQRRPPLPNRWHSDPTLAGMGKLIRECWHGKPAARLPVLRVKKTLVKLASNDPHVHLPLD
ncbi:activin receptor type-1 isoform X1 [Neodiprion fabricii]|uniref:activin receptor type-1 isoform X1 n=2 Tax=Neodiprion fabricii TaxID=2872261 RepID=UPI001ED8F641|nr:activin receptor type-1 isoform X1 [Neodiprion fabricii]